MLALVPVNTFGYKLMLFLHILSVIVAFAPAFVWPVASARLKKEGKPVGPTIGALAAGNTAKIHGPALVLVGFFGFGLAGMSDKVWKFDQSWLMAAAVIWFLMLGIIFGDEEAARGARPVTPDRNGRARWSVPMRCRSIFRPGRNTRPRPGAGRETGGASASAASSASCASLHSVVVLPAPGSPSSAARRSWTKACAMSSYARDSLRAWAVLAERRRR